MTQMKNKKTKQLKLIFIPIAIFCVSLVLPILYGVCGIVSIIMGYDTPKHIKEYMIEIYSNEGKYYNMNIEIESFDNYDDYYIVYFAPLEEYDFLDEYSKKGRFVLHKEMYEIATANGMELEAQKSYTISICLACFRQEDKPQVCSISSIDGSTEYLSSKDGIRIILEWVDGLKTMFNL